MRVNYLFRENECEITIKRVLELGDEQNHTCFVQVDFPYPKEKPQQLKTQTFKGANSPAVNFKSKVSLKILLFLATFILG